MISRETGLPTSFLISIDEDQRAALQTVLESVECPEALEYWVDMLKGLPKEEGESPNIIHGFCL